MISRNDGFLLGCMAVLVCLLLNICSVEAFHPYTGHRYVQPKSAFKVEVKNRAYAANLVQAERIPRKTTNQLNTTSVGSENKVEVPVKPGMSILSTDVNTQAYFVNVTIGDEIYPLVIDSGSAYLWVYGDSCHSESCHNKKLFPTEHVKQASEESSFSLMYSSGVASGNAFDDKIIVNKLATTQNFTFGVADQVPDIFVNYPVSGIFGLPANNSDNIQSIISVLSESNAISQEMFSIIIGSIDAKDDPSTDSASSDALLTENKGLFIIGELEEDLYKGDVHYTPLIPNSEHYWQLKIDSVSVDSNVVNFSHLENVTGSHSPSIRFGIVDSGTTLLILPAQDALDLHTLFTSSISDGTNFAILCNSTQQLELQLNGKNWAISPENYLGEAYPEGPYFGYCVSNIQGLDLDESWILGDVFLKDKYAVFDVEKQQFGVALKNEDAVLVPFLRSNETSNEEQKNHSTSLESATSISTTATSSSTTSSASIGGCHSMKPSSVLSSLFALMLLAF